jgi:hypothetical protein
MQDLTAIQSKVEAFDIKNAELLQRSGKGATQFTQRRWEELTVKVQGRMILSDLISRAKDFFSFLQRNFVFSVLIDCALADLSTYESFADVPCYVDVRSDRFALLQLRLGRSEQRIHLCSREQLKTQSI